MNPNEIMAAIGSGDIERARSLIDLPDQPLPRMLAYLSVYVAHSRDAEIREFVVRHLRQHAVSAADHFDLREGVGVARFNIGLSLLPDHNAARPWFEAAIAAIPDFLPASIELATPDQTARYHRFGWFWDHAPTMAAFYEFAASQMDMRTAQASLPIGLAVRGLCSPTTAAIMKHHRLTMPGATICLATWADSDPAHIEAARPFCDEVLLLPPVERPGHQNRVRQLVLAQAALDWLDGRCDTALMLRSDMMLMRRDLDRHMLGLWRQYPVDLPAMRGRLVISNLYTRKVMLDHPSDLFMFGAISDVRQYWSAPADADHLPEVNFEQYLSKHFRETLGVECRSPAEYRDYLARCFVIRDIEWFEACWIGRREYIRHSGRNMDFHSLVSQSDWEGYHFGSSHSGTWAPSVRGPLLAEAFGRGV